MIRSKRLIFDQTGVDVSVTAINAKFARSQTTGGVKKEFKVSIGFQGVVAAGEDAGSKVRGKVKTKGSFE